MITQEATHADLELAAQIFELFAAGSSEGQIAAGLGMPAEDVARRLYLESARRRAQKRFRDRCREQPHCRRKHGLDTLLDYIPKCRLDVAGNGKTPKGLAS